MAQKGRNLFPGVLAAGTVAIAARFLSEHYGAPVMLFALLLGMGFHFLTEDGSCPAGIEFCSKTLLRTGVALLGLGITIDQITALGGDVISVTLIGVVATIGVGLVAARLLKRGWRFGLLTGGSVAICGASAALAISSVLPRNENTERNTIFTVIAVTSMSTIAMIGYPIIADFLKLDDFSAGFFIGATIHDVAQVVGAGYSISDETGDIATFVKLLRVSMLMPIVLIISLIFRNASGSDGSRKVTFPLFVIGFVVMVLAGSSGYFPAGLKDVVLEISRWCLVIAISALGMKTSLKALREVGGQAIFLICIETVFLAGLILAFIYSQGGFPDYPL